MKTIGADVMVRPSHPAKGEGLFARSDVAKGDFISEYTGEKISTAAADASKSRYLFELDDEWTIDGSPRSNIARYINHSCEPNAEAEIHGLPALSGGRILISATRDISAGEEITIDYGGEYFDEFIRPAGCKCDSPQCRSKKSSHASDKKSGGENQTSAEDDLRDGKPESHLEKMVADVGDRDQFQSDDKIREGERFVEVGEQEGKRVEDSADERHDADDAAADHGVAASGQFSRVGKRFGERHGNAGADGRRTADEKRDVRVVRRERRRENRGER
jgi:hypothetical protein